MHKLTGMNFPLYVCWKPHIGMDEKRDFWEMIRKVCQVLRCNNRETYSTTVVWPCYVKSLNIIHMVRANGLVILCFPPHCTHRSQPLDTTFWSLWMYIATWKYRTGLSLTLENPFEVNIAEILRNAFLRAVTMTAAIYDFKSTCNLVDKSEHFPESAFTTSTTTNMSAGNNEPQQQAEASINLCCCKWE